MSFPDSFWTLLSTRLPMPARPGRCSRQSPPGPALARPTPGSEFRRSPGEAASARFLSLDRHDRQAAPSAPPALSAASLSSPPWGRQSGAREMQVPREALGLLVPRGKAGSSVFTRRFPSGSRCLRGDATASRSLAASGSILPTARVVPWTGGGGAAPGKHLGRGLGLALVFLAPHSRP